MASQGGRHPFFGASISGSCKNYEMSNYSARISVNIASSDFKVQKYFTYT
jgi:hypothetical protein